MNYKINIIYIITFFIILLLIYQFINNHKEGFSVNDINKIIDQTEKIASVAEKIPKELKDVSNQIENVSTEITGEVENVVTIKIKSVLDQIGDVFNSALVKPIMTLFIGIQTIFIQIFNILKEIVNKIISLPACIFTYLFQTILDTIYGIYVFIMPNFIRSPLSVAYKYTLRYPIDFISEYSGYDASVKRCYGFNVDKEINTMNTKLQDINTSFTQNFGKLDFSKIKI